MPSERRAGQTELLETVTRIDERTIALHEGQERMEKRIEKRMDGFDSRLRKLSIHVAIGRGIVVAAAAVAGWAGYNGFRS